MRLNSLPATPHEAASPTALGQRTTAAAASSASADGDVANTYDAPTQAAAADADTSQEAAGVESFGIAAGTTAMGHEPMRA